MFKQYIYSKPWILQYADSVDLFGIFLAIGGVFAPPRPPLAYGPAEESLDW